MVETNACKMIDDAIEDEEKGAKFYRDLASEVMFKMIREDKVPAERAYDEIRRIGRDEEKHKDELERIKNMVCG